MGHGQSFTVSAAHPHLMNYIAHEPPTGFGQKGPIAACFTVRNVNAFSLQLSLKCFMRRNISPVVHVIKHCSSFDWRAKPAGKTFLLIIYSLQLHCLSFRCRRFFPLLLFELYFRPNSTYFDTSAGSHSNSCASCTFLSWGQLTGNPRDTWRTRGFPEKKCPPGAGR